MRIHPEMLKQLRAYYAPGTRIELICINDPYTKLKPGDIGEIIGVDDLGTLHVAWSCGSTLGLIFGEDEYRKVEE